MRVENVEIYSAQTNAAVLRHPERRFPGVLIQGDSLFALCQQADLACAGIASLRGTDAYVQLNEFRNELWSYLTHYKDVLGEHKISLPFSEHVRA